MSRVIVTASAPVATQRPFASLERSLLDVFDARASRIWTLEPDVPVGDSPPNEQRTFRKVHTFTRDKGTPVNATIIVSADDYFAMYVDGVLVQPIDPNNDFRTALAYTVPLPLIERSTDSPTALSLGFRVIQGQGWASLTVAVQVNYADSTEPDVFYTGSDQGWLGEKLFQEHWEQPWFDTALFQSSSWPPAVLIPRTAGNQARPALQRQNMIVFGRVPLQTGPSGPAPTSCNSHPSDNSLGLSPGAFAGIMAGSLILAWALGVIGAIFVLRKRHRKATVEQHGVDGLPATDPGLRITPLSY